MEELWTMRDGTQIAVGDMTEQHAKNCLRMLIRRHRNFSIEGFDALDFYCAKAEIDDAGSQ
jgi:hypothetical protein